MDWLQILWYSSYVAVLLGLSAYGIHRYCIVYLFLKNRNAHPRPLRRLEELPFVTIQLPLFNERYDLVIPVEHYESDLLHPLLDVIRSAEFAQSVNAIGGYETTQMGAVLSEIG